MGPSKSLSGCPRAMVEVSEELKVLPLVTAGDSEISRAVQQGGTGEALVEVIMALVLDQAKLVATEKVVVAEAIDLEEVTAQALEVAELLQDEAAGTQELAHVVEEAGQVQGVEKKPLYLTRDEKNLIIFLHFRPL